MKIETHHVPRYYFVVRAPEHMHMILLEPTCRIITLPMLTPIGSFGN